MLTNVETAGSHMRDGDPIVCAREFLDALGESASAVVLTGAGVSTGSGIPDFRGPGGLYSTVSQRTFELDFFFSETQKYYEIAAEHIHTLADMAPNVTHFMLAEIEKRGLLKAVITQNIDRLHQKGGAEKVVEFHGNVGGFHCVECHKSFERAAVDEKIRAGGVPRCECGSIIRPEIVFFGDPIPQRAIAEGCALARAADLFIAMGSSLRVQPAASLALLAKEAGAQLLIVNRGPTGLDYAADRRYDVPLEEFSAGVMAILKGSAR